MIILNDIEVTKSSKVYRSTSIDEVISGYNALSAALKTFSDIIPTNDEHADMINQDVDCLLDKQQYLLSQALLVEPETLSDIYGFLKLWAEDEFANIAGEDLSPAKLLAYRAFVYLDKVELRF